MHSEGRAHTAIQGDKSIRQLGLLRGGEIPRNGLTYAMLLVLVACFSAPQPKPPAVVAPNVPPICYIDATHTLKVFMSSGAVATGSLQSDGHTVELTGTRTGRDLDFGDLKVSLRGRIATINPGVNPVQLVRAGCQ